MYNVFIAPLEKFLYLLFVFSYNLTGSYGVSILFLSVAVTLVLTPLYMLAYKYESIEKEIQSILAPKLEKINKSYSGAERQKKTQQLYSRYGYSPVYSFRSLLSIFIQVPFFIAAYNMLSHFSPMQGEGFLFIKDLGMPDGLIAGINLLPLLMTVVNIISASMVLNFSKKDRNQAFIIAALFFVILYRSPAGLVLYWTGNNVINMVRNLYFWIKDKNYLHFAIRIKNNFYKYCDEFYPFFVLCTIFFIFSNEVYKRYTTYDNRKIALFVIPAILYQLYHFYKAPRDRVWKKKAWIIGVFIAATVFFIMIRSIRFNTTLALLMIISLIYRKLPTFKPKDRNSLIILVLAVAVPCLSYVSSNLDYFSTRAVFFFIAVFMAGFVLVWFIVSLCAGREDADTRTAAVSAFALLYMLIPMLRNVLGYQSTDNIDFLMYAAAIIPVVYYLIQTRKKLVIAFLTVCCIYFAGFIIMKKPPAVVQADERQSLAARLETKFPPQLEGMQMIDKPNVYVLVYDGIGSKRNLDYFGLNQEERDLRKLLEDNNFKVYDDTYTIGTRSLWSMTCTYEMDYVSKDGDELRLISSGVSRVNSIFARNGYYSYAVLPRFMVKNYYNVNKMLPESKLLLPADLDYALQVVMGLSLGTLDHFKVNVGKNESLQVHSDMVNYVIQEGEPTRFLMSHFNLPEHTNSSGPCTTTDRRQYEKEQWSIRLYQALEYMKRDFDSINEYDPGAIVIIMGDHGVWLTDCSGSLDYTDISDITEDNIHDIVGTYVAIRWPDRARASKYDGDLRTNQDIFPVVFSYLYDSEIPLGFKTKRSFGLDGHMFIDNNGNFIPYGGK